MSRFLAAGFVAILLASGCVEVVKEPEDDSTPSSLGTRWETDQDLAYVTLLAAPDGLDWQEFELRSSAPVHVGRNTQAIADDPAVSDAYVRMPPGPFLAGDFFDVCADDPAGARADLALRHAASGAVEYRETLLEVPPCGIITQ